ncbi:ribonuclease HII [Patescibacteria group bacterium]|nr:ribonuclease HII [Patescibacteria group bacterium]
MVLPDFKIEEKLWEKGYNFVLGIDEVGIGALAGPMVLGGVIYKTPVEIDGVRDSKLLTEKRRQEVFEEIIDRTVYAVGNVTEKEIDRLGITASKSLAIVRLMSKLSIEPEYLLLDGKFIKNFGKPSQYVIKGDQTVTSIAAASIVAKVTRDKILRDLHQEFPVYNFEKHKGYGTSEHLRALEEYGPCKYHRRSYRPVARLINS